MFANCSSSYIGKTSHHFKIRIEEHIENDKKASTFWFISEFKNEAPFLHFP